MRGFDIRKDLRRALIVGGVLLVLNVGFWAVLVRPRIAAYRDLEGGRAGIDQALASAEKEHKALSTYWQRLSTTEANIDRFYKEILGTKQEKSIEIQQELADIAAEFRISPDSVSYDNSDLEDQGLEEFRIDLPIVGDYADLRNFIARIENSNRFLVIDRISLNTSKEGGLQLALSISVSTYFNAPWLKELKAAGKSVRLPRGRT